MRITNLVNTGNSVYDASVDSSAGPHGVLNLTVKGGRPSGFTKRVSLFLISVLTFLAVAVSVMASTTAANANPITNWFDAAFCGDTAYFHAPQPYRNGLASLGIGMLSTQPSFTGANIQILANKLTFGGDADFLTSKGPAGVTAYEKYGMSGATWTVYRGETQTDVNNLKDKIGGDRATHIGKTDLREIRKSNSGCLPIFDIVLTSTANTTLEFTKFWTSVSGWVMSNAYSPDWVKSLNQKVETMIEGPPGGQGLRDTIFFNFLTLVIMLGSLVLFHQGVIKRESNTAVQSLIWMVGAALVGSTLMFNPGLVPNISNAVIDTFTSNILVAVAGTGTGSQNDLCDVTGAAAPLVAPVGGNLDTEDQERANSRKDVVLRTSGCTFWQTFVYAPWVVGQFGVPASELEAPRGAASGDLLFPPSVDLGGGRVINNWAFSQFDAQSLDKVSLASPSHRETINAKKQQWFKVVDAISAEGGMNDYLNTWAGGDGGSRWVVSIAALVASLVGLVVVTIISLSMLGYAVIQSMLMFFSVFFLLLGVHPGFGRRIALNWAELYIGTVLKRIVLAALLAMLIAFYGAVLSDPATGNWGISILAIIALSIGAMGFRKELMNMMGSIDLGGSGINKNPFEKMNAGVKGAATGAALGLVGGGMAAGGAASAARSMGKSGVGAGFKALGTGVKKGAGQGLLHAGGFGSNAMLYSGKSAKSEVERGTSQKLGAHQSQKREEERAAFEQERLERQWDAEEERAQAEEQRHEEATQKEAERQEFESSPEGIAQARRKELARRKASANNYRNDATENWSDAAWQSSFRTKYGFAAPSPDKYIFAGYGRTQGELRDDPSLRPIERAPKQDTQPAVEQPAPQSEQGGEAPSHSGERYSGSSRGTALPPPPPESPSTADPLSGGTDPARLERISKLKNGISNNEREVAASRKKDAEIRNRILDARQNNDKAAEKAAWAEKDALAERVTALRNEIVRERAELDKEIPK